MTTVIFQEWLKKINNKFKSENRNVLLFMDNFSGHQIEAYSNIKIVFFHPILSILPIHPIPNTIS